MSIYRLLSLKKLWNEEGTIVLDTEDIGFLFELAEPQAELIEKLDSQNKELLRILIKLEGNKSDEELDFDK